MPQETAQSLTSAPQLAELREEHARLEALLAAYNDRVHLSAQEQLERKRLQKLKLRAKDRIALLETR